MAMNNWCANKIKKKGKASRTPGKTKGPNCQTGGHKKFFASSPKAYKHSDYAQWHEHFKAINKGGMK